MFCMCSLSASSQTVLCDFLATLLSLLEISPFVTSQGALGNKKTLLLSPTKHVALTAKGWTQPKQFSVDRKTLWDN